MNARWSTAAVLGVSLILALAAPASAQNIDVRGEWDFECGGPCGAQTHTFETQDPETGDLTGRGRSAGGGTTWTITGKVTGDQIQFTLDYDNSSYAANANGTISPDGQRITGTFSDTGGGNYSFSMNRLGPPPGDPPPPQAGENVNVKPVTGTVRVKCRGDSSYEELEGTDQIPVGCLLDTRKGTVNITASTGEGTTNSSWFWQGIFKVSQKKGTNQDTQVTLAGPLENCSSTKKSALEAAAKRRGRRLWGKGSGRFTTRGRRGAASVRGTTWLVEDRCDGSTSVRVKKGSVNFRDFVTKRTVVVKQGETYVARP